MQMNLQYQDDMLHLLLFLISLLLLFLFYQFEVEAFEVFVSVQYLDPLADDRQDCVDSIDRPHVILMAHNRQITYGYTGTQAEDRAYCKFPTGSVLVDPWRQQQNVPGITVIHYGNTRKS
jgi:hypothetical protein